MSGYDKIRFMGYAIPTAPADLQFIADSIIGTNLGNPDYKTDIDARIAVLVNGVETARAQLPKGEEGVINVFMAPEFFFHGTQGPYVYETEEANPINYLQIQLKKVFSRKRYANWVFICGTAMSSYMRDQEVVFSASSTRVRNEVVKSLTANYLNSHGSINSLIGGILNDFVSGSHHIPVCQVRDQSIVVSNIPIRLPGQEKTTRLMRTEKYHVSNEDLVLYDTSGKEVVTEQMADYPFIDLSGGDAKESFFDMFAIFSQDVGASTLNYGIEICLDHKDNRLRANIDNEPKVPAGVTLQFIPSCGMKLQPNAIAAVRNGFVFLCDGLDNVNGGGIGQDVINGVDCLYANYGFNNTYGAHTQLAKVAKEAKGSNPYAPGSRDAFLYTLDASRVSRVPVSPKKVPFLSEYFAAGPGEIHFYGLDEPFQLD